MKSDSSLAKMSKRSATAIKFVLAAIVGVTSTFLIYIPAHAHHPFEGRAAESYNSIEGLLSGLAHPILGLDHFLFLFSIGLVGSLSIRRWVPLLLLCGIAGTLLSWFYPSVFTQSEVIIGLSLLGSALSARGLIKPVVIFPLIASHGYVLGQSMIGAEPTPLMAYLLGLSITQGITIICGCLLLRRFIQYRNVFIGCLLGAGIIFTYGAISSLV